MFDKPRALIIALIAAAMLAIKAAIIGSSVGKAARAATKSAKGSAWTVMMNGDWNQIVGSLKTNFHNSTRITLNVICRMNSFMVKWIVKFWVSSFVNYFGTFQNWFVPRLVKKQFRFLHRIVLPKHSWFKNKNVLFLPMLPIYLAQSQAR